MSVSLDVKARMVQLEELDRPALCQMWKKKFGKTPPNYTSMSFMRKVLIWEAQKEVFGVIPVYLTRALKLAAEDRRLATKASDSLRPGSVLVREWNGRNYQVEVTNEGFRFDGHDYRSLSAISRKITGTNWPGRASSVCSPGKATTDDTAAMRNLHPQELRRRPRTGLQLA